MNYHTVASLFPMMNNDEYAALVADIHQYGQREPIWILNGEIIDGRNRWKACHDLGIAPHTREYTGPVDMPSLVSFVVSLNLKRRHLTSVQLGFVALEIEKILSDEARKNMSAGGGDKKSGFQLIENPIPIEPIHAAKQAAAIVGTNHTYVSAAKKLTKEAPDLADRARTGSLSMADARRELKKRERTIERLERATHFDALLPSDRYQLFRSDIRSLDIAQGTIDAIITDPPYPKEYLPLYADLARLASRVLRPGGSLFVMIGQSYLPEIVALIAPFVAYHWTLAYLTPGGQAVQLWQRNVNTFWKPVLWFVNGGYTGEWIGDVARSSVNDNDKRFHEWGQSESGMADLITRCSRPNDLILDPFCGAGTTGVAALAHGRRFVGADISQDAIDTTANRLAEIEQCNLAA